MWDGSVQPNSKVVRTGHQHSRDANHGLGPPHTTTLESAPRAVTEFIRIHKWPADHAQEAYDAGYYIEAIQTLHGWLEIKLRELLQLQRTARPGPERDGEWGHAWDMTHDLSLNSIAKALFISGALPEDVLNRILGFNRVRNNLVHKLFRDPYEKEYLGIPKEEYDAAFHAGVELGELIESMSAERVG